MSQPEFSLRRKPGITEMQEDRLLIELGYRKTASIRDRFPLLVLKNDLFHHSRIVFDWK